VLRTDAGLSFFNGCQLAVDQFIAFADEGNRLVFGPLAKPDVLSKSFGPENTFLFVITVTGTIILIAAVSRCSTIGILQLVVAGWPGSCAVS
jgi:CNT family concentrative nucleoside transporter